MEQAIELNIGGIKCDTSGCDYKDDSVTVEDYPQWLNKPCPKCSGNLLTEEDYIRVQMMINFAKTMNAILPPPDKDEELFKLNVELNGTGNADMTIEKHEKE